MKYGKTRDIVFCGLFIALITLGTFIRIPIGNDFYTLQFLFTLLAGLVLGPRLGALAVGAYVLLGLLGVPVFASGGGPGYLAQPTFGYLVGFIVQAWFCGAGTPAPSGRCCWSTWAAWLSSISSALSGSTFPRILLSTRPFPSGG